MDEGDHQAPGLGTLLRHASQTSLGLLRNRAELFSVEWQEEKSRLAQLLVWSLGVLFLAVLAIALVTATVIALIPEDYRVWAMAGFAVFYGLGAVAAIIVLKRLLKKEPFCESIEQVRKDVSLMKGENEGA